jgi:hypothetical protein
MCVGTSREILKALASIVLTVPSSKDLQEKMKMLHPKKKESKERKIELEAYVLGNMSMI